MAGRRGTHLAHVIAAADGDQMDFREALELCAARVESHEVALAEDRSQQRPQNVEVEREAAEAADVAAFRLTRSEADAKKAVDRVLSLRTESADLRRELQRKPDDTELQDIQDQLMALRLASPLDGSQVGVQAEQTSTRFTPEVPPTRPRGVGRLWGAVMNLARDLDPLPVQDEASMVSPDDWRHPGATSLADSETMILREVLESWQSRTSDQLLKMNDVHEQLTDEVAEVASLSDEARELGTALREASTRTSRLRAELARERSELGARKLAARRRLKADFQEYYEHVLANIEEANVLSTGKAGSQFDALRARLLNLERTLGKEYEDDGFAWELEGPTTVEDFLETVV